MMRAVALAAGALLAGPTDPVNLTYGYVLSATSFYEQHTSGFADQSALGRNDKIQGISQGTINRSDTGTIKLAVYPTLPGGTVLVNVSEMSKRAGAIFPVLVRLPADGTVDFDRAASVTEEERTLVHFFTSTFLPAGVKAGDAWTVESLWPGEKDVARYQLVKIDGPNAYVSFDRILTADLLGRSRIEAHGKLTYDTVAKLPSAVHMDFTLLSGGAADHSSIDYTKQ